MVTSGKTSSVQTRLSRCATHGVVEATRKMPRLLFPFIITGAMRLVALTRPFRCPKCGAKADRV